LKPIQSTIEFAVFTHIEGVHQQVGNCGEGRPSLIVLTKISSTQSERAPQSSSLLTSQLSFLLKPTPALAFSLDFSVFANRQIHERVPFLLLLCFRTTMPPLGDETQRFFISFIKQNVNTKDDS